MLIGDIKGSEERMHINAATKFFYLYANKWINYVASDYYIGINLLSIISQMVFFSYHDLLNTKMFELSQYLLMLGFFIAFLVKMPLVPFHGWIADAQE